MLTRPPHLLRLEGLVLFVAVLVVYGAFGFSWWLLAALLLVPDLSMLAYARGPQFGARVYNAVHSSVLPLGLAVAGHLARSDGVLLVGLVWLGHVAVDRAFGYGLKLPTGFHDTHLGPIGRGRRSADRAG